MTVVLSAGNYAFSFAIVHLLGPTEFAHFVAAQGLFLVIGSGCMAAIPWSMARFIAERRSVRARREAMYFGLVASAIQGLVAAVIAGALLWQTAGAAVGFVAAVGTFAISLVAVPVGFLQGVDRIGAISGLRILEFVFRVCSASLVVVLLSRSAPAALIGYPIGSAVLILAGLFMARSGFPPMRGEARAIRALVRHSASLGAIQVFLSMLTAIDTIAVLAAHLHTAATASYQAAALLGRVPLFLSTAISLALYTHLVTATSDKDVRSRMQQALSMYAALTVPFVIACVTVPPSILHTLLPASYSDTTRLLRYTAISGAAVGWIDAVSTAHQARARFRPAIWILGIAAILQPAVLIFAGRSAGVWAFATALTIVSVVTAVALTVDGRSWIPTRINPTMPILYLLALAGTLALRSSVPAWFGVIALTFAVGLRVFWSKTRDGTKQAASVALAET